MHVIPISGAAAAGPAARRLRRRQARVQLQAQARHVRHQAQVHAAQEGVPLLVSEAVLPGTFLNLHTNSSDDL